MWWVLFKLMKASSKSGSNRLQTVRAEGYRFNSVLDPSPRCGRAERASLMQWWLIAPMAQLNFSSLATGLAKFVSPSCSAMSGSLLFTLSAE